MEENVKSKNTSKVKDRRQQCNQDGMPKKGSKHPGLIKNDLSQLAPPQTFDVSPVKKILCEANKIVKIGMEKDYALLERDNTLQNSNEMVDNLRKNILHLQMEYEKLDQNYQKEISYRSEMIKRMDTTQTLVDSVIQCSNALSKSLKLLEEDKLKIAEFYELIYQNQKEVENKQAGMEKFIKEQDELIKSKIEDIKTSYDKNVTQHSETVARLNKELYHANDKLKVLTNENEKLQKKIQEVQESSHKLEESLIQQQKLNRLHEENVVKFKHSLKKLKIQRFKYQKLWKYRNMHFAAVVKKNKFLKKSLSKTTLLYDQCLLANKTLISKKDELENKFEKHLKDGESKLKNWETERNKLNFQVCEMEAEIKNLKSDNKNLKEKLLEAAENENLKQANLEKIESELSKMLSENLKLKEHVTKLNQDNNNKSKVILELQKKATSFNDDLNVQIKTHKKNSEKLQELVNELESQLSDMEKRLAFEKKEKEGVIHNSCSIEENLKVSNQKINNLEKLLEEKKACIQKLEFEGKQIIFNNQKTVEKLENQIQIETCKNKELNKTLENIKESHKDANEQLEKAKEQILHFKKKLADLTLLNQTMNRTQNELETNVASLKKETELHKKSVKVLEEKNIKSEKELVKMQKMAEENATLKSSVGDLKNLLEATEARVEAYKVVVKKLESEKVKATNAHSEEVSKFKFKLAHLEEERNIHKDSCELKTGTPKKNFENMVTKKETETPFSKTKDKPKDSSSQILNMKENEPEVVDIGKWPQTSTSPLQGCKKFLSTPRKIYTSTPQSNLRSRTPVQKKKDPYEFDSDSSVERFDQDQVLKVFNRQKKEANKRSKTK